jgi:hypothetical protein
LDEINPNFDVETQSDSLEVEIPAEKPSTPVAVTQWSSFSSDGIEKYLSEENEFSEPVTCEKEERTRRRKGSIRLSL